MTADQRDTVAAGVLCTKKCVQQNPGETKAGTGSYHAQIHLAVVRVGIRSEAEAAAFVGKVVAGDKADVRQRNFALVVNGERSVCPAAADDLLDAKDNIGKLPQMEAVEDFL